LKVPKEKKIERIIIQPYYLEENDTKSIKPCTLNDTDKAVQETIVLRLTDKAVQETIVLRLTEKEALEYLRDQGFQMSRAKYFRHKRKLEETILQRLYTIVKYGFTKQHLEKIDKLEMIEKHMWKDYFDCKDSYKRVEILTQIANLQPIPIKINILTHLQPDSSSYPDGIFLF
jgi:hypothetical protein